MPSIFKRSTKKGSPYFIQYYDQDGVRRTVKGYTDKGLTEQLAAKLDMEARLRRDGIVDAEQEMYSKNKLLPIQIHIDAFKAAQSDNTLKYSELIVQRLQTVVVGCKISCLAHFEAASIRDFLQSIRKSEGIGHRTYNHYLDACGTFLNWCVRTRRLLSNPILGIGKLNTEVDIRHPRRALTPDEIARLLHSVAKSNKHYQRQSPQTRIRVYTTAYLTGLRKQELASLTPSSFRLEDNPPTLTIEASRSKHRKKDVLPLHPQLLEELRIWTKGMKAKEFLFPGLGSKKLSEMVQRDLRDAGIPYRTEDGIADFHAAGRHTYITQLIRSGVALPTAMELARHSDIRMTMRYTHIGLEDQAEALANLKSPVGEEISIALQMRCTSRVIDCHNGAQSAANAESVETKKRRKSFPGKTYGVSCHDVANATEAEGTGLEPATPYGAHHFQ